GSRADDEDGDNDNDNDHHSHVEPQQPKSTCQMAINKATDTTDPNAMGAGPAVPVGMTNGPPNKGRNIEKVDEAGEWASGSVTPSSNDDGGDKNIHHTYVVPNTTRPPPYHTLPTPDEQRQPPGMLLEGEKTGQQSSRCTDETGMHLDVSEQRCQRDERVSTPYPTQSHHLPT
ncbi:hypothetical protein PAXRUDRAFT_170225, partial [Paxillus rubicundulus Ve08.2h10]